MKEITKASLQGFLLNHEYDIFKGTRDYGRLNSVFIELIGRHPTKQKPASIIYTYGSLDSKQPHV